jgi:proteasome lid subunit RPN8/RPN11
LGKFAEKNSGLEGPEMRIPREILDDMVAHARQEWPYECCGLVAGKDDLATRIYRLSNQKRSRTLYLAAPEEQLQALTEMEDLGLDLLAIYHTHPDTESYPSAVDVEKAYFPEALCLIISLKMKDPQIRGFRISQNGEISEEDLEVL